MTPALLAYVGHACDWCHRPRACALFRWPSEAPRTYELVTICAPCREGLNV